ncbi:MAG: hypothetical protein R3E86_11585 [Pseudomonadales bacterium]
MDHQAFAQLLGNYGEFVGAIAVVATLLYLAAQVRNSNRYEAAKHIDVHMDRIRERFLVIAQNEDLARIDRIGTQGGNLTADERWRWRAFAIHQILCMRDAWLRADRLGGLPDRPSRFYLDLLSELLIRHPAMREVWDAESADQPAWSGELVDYVNRKLASE